MAAGRSITSAATAASISRSAPSLKLSAPLAATSAAPKTSSTSSTTAPARFSFPPRTRHRSTATCIAAFDLLESEPERIDRLWENTRYFKSELGRLGFNIGGVNTPASETPITPIIIGDGRQTMDFSRALFDAGVIGTGIAFPTVPEGKARIRTIMTSEHTREQLDQALEILEKTAKKMGILG